MSDEPTVTKHEPRWRGTGYGGGAMVCRCGDDCEDGYSAHLEPLVAERIAQARREAWDEGYNQGVADERMSQETTVGEIPPNRVNPHRAALRGDA